TRLTSAPCTARNHHRRPRSAVANVPETDFVARFVVRRDQLPVVIALDVGPVQPDVTRPAGEAAAGGAPGSVSPPAGIPVIGPVVVDIMVVIIDPVGL